MQMRCFKVKEFGKAREVLFSDTCDKPLRGKGELLIAVLACGITPGDVRMWSGEVDYMRWPTGGFPYIPLGDIYGIVEEADEDSQWKRGDRVVSTWEMQGEGGLCEFVIVVDDQLVRVPPEMSPKAGVALVNSGAYAYHGIHTVARIQANERVLILGGSGGKR